MDAVNWHVGVCVCPVCPTSPVAMSGSHTWRGFYGFDKPGKALTGRGDARKSICVTLLSTTVLYKSCVNVKHGEKTSRKVGLSAACTRRSLYVES